MLTDNKHIDKETIKKTGSIYTPLDIVKKMMAKVEDKFWSDPTKTFCDPTCGTGAIIIPMLDNRVKHGIDPTVALKTMYGNELLKESYDILMKNLEDWAAAHNVTDTSWKANFYNMAFFEWIKMVDDPTCGLNDFFGVSKRIDCFIMNPPYNCYFLHTQICNEVRKHADNAIAVCPINKSIRYKTCEFLDKPFGDQIAWNNVFIMDLMGDNNEYFSTKNSIFVKHTTDPFYTMWYKNGKYIIDNSERNLELGHNIILDENRLYEIQKFFDWLNTTDNEIVKNSAHITTVRPSRYNINKLWEIYQNEKEG